MAETPTDTEIIDWMEAQVRAAPDGPRTIHALNVDGRGLPENMTLRESFSLMMQAAKQRDDSVRIPWVEASHPDYGRMQWNTHDIGVSEVTPPAAPSVVEPPCWKCVNMRQFGTKDEARIARYHASGHSIESVLAAPEFLVGPPEYVANLGNTPRLDIDLTEGGYVSVPPATAEQEARDLMERAGVPDAQSYTAGDVIEIANLLRELSALRSSLEEARKDSALLADAVYVARGALVNDDVMEAFSRLDNVLAIADRIIHEPRIDFESAAEWVWSDDERPAENAHFDASSPSISSASNDLTDLQPRAPSPREP